MDKIIDDVLLHLQYTGIGMGLFVVCYLSNMAYSLYYNIKVLNQEFDWKRIRDSLIQILAFGIGTVLLCIGVTTIPAFCEHIGLQIPQEYSEIFEKLAIISVFVYSACKYAVEAYGKFKKILEGKKEETVTVTQTITETTTE